MKKFKNIILESKKSQEIDDIIKLNRILINTETNLNSKLDEYFLNLFDKYGVDVIGVDIDHYIKDENVIKYIQKFDGDKYGFFTTMTYYPNEVDLHTKYNIFWDFCQNYDELNNILRYSMNGDLIDTVETLVKNNINKIKIDFSNLYGESVDVYEYFNSYDFQKLILDNHRFDLFKELKENKQFKIYNDIKVDYYDLDMGLDLGTII